jgi:hypothetical protein
MSNLSSVCQGQKSRGKLKSFSSNEKKKMWLSSNQDDYLIR